MPFGALVSCCRGKGQNPAVFNPLSLSPALWVKADVGTLQTNGGSAAVADADPVGEWQDQSGNARHLAQGTSTKRPILKLNIQNGKPIIRFDGVDDFLQKAFTLNQPEHIFAIVKHRTWASGQRLWDAGATFNNMGLMDQTSTPTIAMYAQGGAVAPTSNGLAVDTFGLLECRYEGASSSIIVNAGAADTSALTGTAAGGGITLGADPNGTNPSTLDIGELLIFPSVISGANLTALRAYLNGRWSVY